LIFIIYIKDISTFISASYTAANLATKSYPKEEEAPAEITQLKNI
jgi:hypothetical protein